MKFYKIVSYTFVGEEIAFVAANNENEAKKLLLKSNYFTSRNSDYWDVAEINKPGILHHYIRD